MWSMGHIHLPGYFCNAPHILDPALKGGGGGEEEDKEEETTSSEVCSSPLIKTKGLHLSPIQALY